MKKNEGHRTVWNSDQGWVGDKREGANVNKKKKPGKGSKRLTGAGFPNDGVTRVRREKGGRGGKTVTVLYGVPGGRENRETLLKELKQHCGCGGALKEGRIEIQGDHRDRILRLLEEKGIEAKAAGG